MVEPVLVDPGPHPTSNRSKIVQALCTAVNLVGGKKESATFQHPAESLKSSFVGHLRRLAFWLRWRTYELHRGDRPRSLISETQH